MDRGHIFRRMFHLCAPGILVYYVFPKTFFGISKDAWLIIGLMLLLILEAARLFLGKVFFGMRGYEKDQISAYAWAGMGVTLAFLVFPMPFVICAVVGLGWTDPIIGELRKKNKMKYYPWLPIVFYFLIVFCCLVLFSEIPWLAIVILASVGSLGAIAVEKPKIPVDDDFLMLIIPLLVMTLVYEYMVIADLVGI